MTGESTSTPIGVIGGGGKLRNGLFLERVALYEDRIAFEVFASRPFGTHDLAALSLADDAGTRYEMIPFETGVIDGRSSIEFRPPVPPDWSRLHLGEPGWGLHIVRRVD